MDDDRYAAPDEQRDRRRPPPSGERVEPGLHGRVREDRGPPDHRDPEPARDLDGDRRGLDAARGMADETQTAPGYAKTDLGVEIKSIRKDEADKWTLQGRRITVPVAGAGRGLPHHRRLRRAAWLRTA